MIKCEYKCCPDIVSKDINLILAFRVCNEDAYRLFHSPLAQTQRQVFVCCWGCTKGLSVDCSPACMLPSSDYTMYRRSDRGPVLGCQWPVEITTGHAGPECLATKVFPNLSLNQPITKPPPAKNAMPIAVTRLQWPIVTCTAPAASQWWGDNRSPNESKKLKYNGRVPVCSS